MLYSTRDISTNLIKDLTAMMTAATTPSIRYKTVEYGRNCNLLYLIIRCNILMNKVRACA